MISPPLSPFDDSAQVYDRELRAQGGAFQPYRDAIWRWLHHLMPPGGRILDLGCGSGEDSAYLAATGRRVVAVDPSAEMLNVTAAKARARGLAGRVETLQASAGELARAWPEELGPIDGVVSSLGPLNGEADLGPVAAALGAHLSPGAPVVIAPMGRLCPWEVAWFMALGRPARALARLAPGPVPVRVGGGTQPTWFHGHRTLREAFSPCFHIVHRRGLGCVAPPPWLSEHPWVAPLLEPLRLLDQHVGRWPLFRRTGDHLLWVMRRR